MSRRRSTGDLVPRDITEILAREARAQRGQRKPGSSLGQAFGWLKGSRKKKGIGNGLNRTCAGVTDAKLGQNHDPAKAGPKGNEDQKRLSVHYAASQHYQENVFIEGSRPQYLEDLHTEAQEGLKILQQEEHKNGVNFVDNESIASTDTLRPEQDISSKDEDGSPESRSTAANTESAVTSAVLTRPVLTRQGSTFKPLNPVKRFDKTRKRSRRTTIMGIPNQVQKELALHRSSTFQPLVSTQLTNHNRQVTDSQSGVVIIPTVDGGTPVENKEGARVHLSELEASGDEQLLRKHLQAVYQDEQLFNQQGFGSQLFPSSVLRPKSLAVPGMTTSSFSPSMFSYLQEPQGPVMSMSPQATYLSTIIPNAVLPASIDVIEIDRSSSRGRGNSVNHGGRVRTVSKNSLASLDSSVSPLLSRRSDDDGSQTDESHSNSTLIPVSILGSNRSESSKTIISNSSPISSKGSTHSCTSQRVGPNEQESQAEQSGGDQDYISLHSSVSTISCPSSKNKDTVTGEDSESGVSGSVVAGEETKNKRNSTRNCSLSVMKTKQPPAPPQRTNSLHNNKISSNFRLLVNKDVNSSASREAATATGNIVAKDEIESGTADYSKIPALILDSTGSSSADASSSSFNPIPVSSSEARGATEPQPESSPQKTPSDGGKFERTMSPSSGYSSQSGTPTLSPKGISSTSPDKQKKKPVKPERSVSRASSSAASPSSSLTSLSSGTSEPVNPDVSICNRSLPPQGPLLTDGVKEVTSNTKPLRLEVEELFNIPPPPKVKAPCPPPPETWVHNRRTFELLCGPCTNVSKVSQKLAQIQDSTVKQIESQTESSKNSQVLVENKPLTEQAVSELSASKAITETVIVTIPDVVHKDLEGRESPSTKQEAVIIQGNVDANADLQRQEQTCSPVVMDPESQETSPKKDPPPVMKKPLTVLHREEVTKQPFEGQQKEICSIAIVEVNSPVQNHATSPQNGDTALDEEDRSLFPYMQVLSVDAPKMNMASPPPTPPPAYQPTPPLSRRTPPSSVSMPPDELQKVQEEIPTSESCWPPPPPPLEGDSVFDGGDEIDFPPPPPPFTADSAPDVKDRTTKTLAMKEVEDAIKDSGNDETPLRGQNSDLPISVPQTAVNDNKPDFIMQVSKENTDGSSCRPVQTLPSFSYSVLSPTMEGPPSITVTRVENLSSPSALASPSSFLKPDSLKTEAQFSTEPPVNVQHPPQIAVPAAPPLPVENLTPGVNFKRQPSIANRTKELLARHKSVPIPKEDANIPLVTPSLLQMVRLRSVNLVEDQVKSPSEDKSTSDGSPVQECNPVSIPGPQHTPQKPIRKSLSLKSSPQTVKASSVTLNAPSMRLQEAIRMKTAAMSSRDGLPSRLGMRSSVYNCINEPGGLSLKSPEACDMHKSPASTASFIFSRSTKKVVIDTVAAPSPEVQASLKQSLAAEFMQFSDQSNTATFSNGGVKSDKVPPPVARKPSHSSISPQNLPACSTKMELTVEGIGAAGAGQHTRPITPPETTTTRVTADTIETLF